MFEARIDGKPASLDAAAERAAEILSRARLPLLAGLGADVAGARASISLIERLRGAYDHLRSDSIFPDLDVMRQAGLMYTTPNEARLRADVFVFVGKDLTQVWPQLLERLAPAEAPLYDLTPEKRKVVWIDPGPGVGELGGLEIEALEAPDLRLSLAALRARVSSRPISSPAAEKEKLDRIAKILNGAHFGVIIWGGADLDHLAIEMIYGLLTDLNKTTRFTGLPLGAGDNAQGVVQTSGWMTGFPMRTSFGRGFPEHDAWAFNARRLVESGEADAALWISAYDRQTPDWKKDVPLIALVPPQTQFSREPQVRLEVGRPGVDHGGAEFAREASAIISREASSQSDAPSVAAVIGKIAQYVGGDV